MMELGRSRGSGARLGLMLAALAMAGTAPAMVSNMPSLRSAGPRRRRPPTPAAVVQRRRETNAEIAAWNASVQARRDAKLAARRGR
jgi:hypothetical protein